MTSFAAVLPDDVRKELRKLLRERAAEWQRAFFAHDLLMARGIRGVQLEAVAEFDRLVVRPLLKSIPQHLAALPEAKSGSLTRDLMPEVEQLRNEIGRTVQAGADAVRKTVETRMVEIGKQEVRWLDQTARRMDPKFGAQVEGRFGEGIRTVEKSVREQTWLGDSTEKWFAKDLAQPTADNVRRWITTGIKSGMSTDEIVRGLKGTKTQSGLLSEKPRHVVEALVRSASTHASAVGRLESFKALGVSHWMFRATLDQRTSIQCASEDGNVYLLGDGPVPPLHPNCRSVALPMPDPDAKPVGQRASIKGRVPAATKFEEWLATIPRDEQDMVLGKTKAAAWRDGKLTLRDMIGSRMQPLTLAELREMERI